MALSRERALYYGKKALYQVLKGHWQRKQGLERLRKEVARHSEKRASANAFGEWRALFKNMRKQYITYAFIVI